MKFLLLAFPLLLTLSFSLSGHCVTQSVPSLSQNIPTPFTTNCTVNVTNNRNYIRKINTITRVSLDSFGRNTTIYLPLTNPLIVGLTQNPVFTRTGPNMTALGSTITSNGKAMKQLAATLEDIVDQWTASEVSYTSTYAHPNASERRQFVDYINNITRSSLQQLGRANSRLERITNPLSATILFSPVTSLGYTLFTVNQNISKAAGNLKGLAETLHEMARKWAMTTAQFTDQEAALCGPSAVTVQPVTVESVTRAVPVTSSQSVQFDQQCLASRPTNRSFINALNDQTQQTLTDFGRANTRLQPLSTALWLGLRFSILTQKGYTAYNYNQDIGLTATELKAFAEAILNVTRQWHEAQEQFARESNRDCRVLPIAVTTIDPLINPRVVPDAETFTAAPAVVTITPTENVASTSPASQTLAPSDAPEAVSTVAPVTEVSTAAAAVTSKTVETSTFTVVPSTASAAPREVSTVVSPVTEVATAGAPVTSVIVETSPSTAAPETASDAPREVLTDVSPVSEVTTAAASVTSVIIEASTPSVVANTASAVPEEASTLENFIN